MLYSVGQGKPRDIKTAIEYIKIAAREGNRDAQCHLGSLYTDGVGTEIMKNPQEAVANYMKAGIKGDQWAQYSLGEAYYKGTMGLAKDYKTAHVWIEKSANQGNKFAQIRLGVMYLKGRGVQRRDLSEAKKLFEAAAEQDQDIGIDETNANYHLEKLQKACIIM